MGTFIKSESDALSKTVVAIDFNVNEGQTGRTYILKEDYSGIAKGSVVTVKNDGSLDVISDSLKFYDTDEFKQSIYNTLSNYSFIDEDKFDQQWDGDVLLLKDPDEHFRIAYSSTNYEYINWNNDESMSAIVPRIVKIVHLSDKHKRLGDSSANDGISYRCKSITDANINDITCIGTWCFTGCNKLSAISCENVVRFGNGGSFSGCEALSAIAIPKASIFKSYLFRNCSNLRLIDMSKKEDDVIPIVESQTLTFSGIYSDFKVLVPKRLLEKWKAEPTWAAFADHVVSSLA